jgi:RNA polymerase sigma factor (sigma-70 family)
MMAQDNSQGRHLEALYAELQPQLARILASNLEAPAWVIDEACQAAWGSLLLQRPELAAGQELGWLSTTATRTALRALRRERHTDPHEQLPEPACLEDRRTAQPEPERAVELRERLAEIKRLPIRQQRVVMLHGFGYEYREIAAVTGDSRRTVQRQLTRARQRLTRLAEEA